MLPGAREMTGWIIKQAVEQAGRSPRARFEMVSQPAGGKTLLTYVNWSRPVKLADVQAVSIVTAEASIFDMVDALATGDGRSAQRLLHQLLEAQDAFSIWPMVIRQFRLLLLAREVIDQHGGLPELQQALGASEFVAKKAMGQARRFSLPALEKIYHKLLDVDEAAKTGRMPLQLSLEMLVAELTA
jgi:DNA polymerase-3 subunit delta